MGHKDDSASLGRVSLEFLMYSQITDQGLLGNDASMSC